MVLGGVGGGSCVGGGGAGLIPNTPNGVLGWGGIYTHISQFELKKTCEKKKFRLYSYLSVLKIFF